MSKKLKKGRSQARRHGGNSGGLPGWAWMVLGIVLTVMVIFFRRGLLGTVLDRLLGRSA
mgnify:CR=1 FL=1